MKAQRKARSAHDEMIGDYHVLKEIDSGGVGTVYKVSRGSNTYALKILSQKPSPQWEQRFREEFKLLQLCNHPSVVQVIDRGEADSPGSRGRNRPFIVMEFVEGVSLWDHHNLEIFSRTDDTVRMIRMIARGLEYAHSQGVVHRDLKPKNILVRRPSNQPVIIDFGFAKDLLRESGESSVGTWWPVGDKRYSCLHSLSEPRKANESDDIWSLGAIFYELLTQKVPFPSGTRPSDLMETLRKGDYIDVQEASPDVPDEVAFIVRKMLGNGQTSGYLNCRYLIRDLDRLPAFRNELNLVHITKNLATAQTATYQRLVNRVYGPINLQRSYYEIGARLTKSMGRTNAALVDLAQKRETLKDEFFHRTGAERLRIADYLARSFIWLFSLALRVGVDLETAVWAKYPGVCPYCRDTHQPPNPGCTKETKRAIDLWRLRDIANKSAAKLPKSLRDWELLFEAIYPDTISKGYNYLSTKLVEELGEVEGELTKPRKRLQVLRERAVDTFGFEMADLFAWSCQVSSSLKDPSSAAESSMLGNAIATVFKHEICPRCLDAICTCDLELDTEEEKAMAYRFLDPLPGRIPHFTVEGLRP